MRNDKKRKTISFTRRLLCRSRKTKYKIEWLINNSSGEILVESWSRRRRFHPTECLIRCTVHEFSDKLRRVGFWSFRFLWTSHRTRDNYSILFAEEWWILVNGYRISNWAPQARSKRVFFSAVTGTCGGHSPPPTPQQPTILKRWGFLFFSRYFAVFTPMGNYE